MPVEASTIRSFNSCLSLQFFTDVSMVAPTVELATRLYHHKVPIYMYTFNHAHSMYQPANRYVYPAEFCVKLFHVTSQVSL